MKRNYKEKMIKRKNMFVEKIYSTSFLYGFFVIELIFLISIPGRFYKNINMHAYNFTKENKIVTSYKRQKLL